jgi:hypothetical protein
MFKLHTFGFDTFYTFIYHPTIMITTTTTRHFSVQHTFMQLNMITYNSVKMEFTIHATASVNIYCTFKSNYKQFFWLAQHS